MMDREAWRAAIHEVAESRTWLSDWIELNWTEEWNKNYALLGFPGGSVGRESACNVGDLGLIPGLDDPLEEGMATHSSILAWRIPMDRGAWWAAVHGVTKSWTWTEWLSTHIRLKFLVFLGVLLRR